MIIIIRKILGILDILTGILLLVLLELSNTPPIFSTIMTLTLFIGWIFPYIALMLSGIAILIHTKYILSITFNIINILLSMIIIFLIISVYEKKLLLVIIEYIIIIVLCIFNLIYIIINKEEIKQDNFKRDYLE